MGEDLKRRNNGLVKFYRHSSYPCRSGLDSLADYIGGDYLGDDMTHEELYISVAKYCPEQFRAFLFNRDQNCNGCVNYVKSQIKGVETRGCKASIDFHWALENECDQRKETQTTLFDLI